MALQLSMASPSGALATYHRIADHNVSHRRQAIQVVMESFVDKACRQEGKQPLSAHTIEVPYTAELADGGRKALYEYVVGSHEEEVGSVDSEKSTQSVPNVPGWESAVAD